MATLDFEQEKQRFRTFYAVHYPALESAKNHYIKTIDDIIRQSGMVEITKIEGRIKDQEECIKKFHRKYQDRLENQEQAYEIKDYLTDLIGIRIVCLYEDHIALVSEALQRHYRTIDVTDKITAMESTEDLFGYKGLHMDLVPAENTGTTPDTSYAFEVQIRSLIQDTWSVLDHKIKYKKSIPNNLKRRINVLSALFELADREFKEIRNATSELIEQATAGIISDGLILSEAEDLHNGGSSRTINAFHFLRVAGHFFRDFDFQDYKVDNFVQDILAMDDCFKRSDLHQALVDNLKIVKEYRSLFLTTNPDNTFSPYTTIRHCLFLHAPQTFSRILSKGPKERFTRWLKSTGERRTKTPTDPEQ